MTGKLPAASCMSGSSNEICVGMTGKLDAAKRRIPSFT